MATGRDLGLGHLAHGLPAALLSGVAAIALICAGGLAQIDDLSDGAPSITVAASDGTVEQVAALSGAPSIDVTAAGSFEDIATVGGSGAIDVTPSGGTLAQAATLADGAPAIVVTATAGTVEDVAALTDGAPAVTVAASGGALQDIAALVDGAPIIGVSATGGTLVADWIPASEVNLVFWHPPFQSNITFATPAITNSTRYQVSSIASHPAATLGGTLDATGVVDWAGGPPTISTNYGRLAFASTTSKLTSSLAASSFKFLHDFSGETTIAFTNYTYSAAPNGGVYLNTKAAAGTGVGIGLTCGVNSSGAVYVSIGNGTAAKTITSANTIIAANSWNDFQIRLSSSQTNKLELWINGSLVASSNTLSGFTPSSSNPGATLQVGDSQGNITGGVTPPVMWNAYASSGTLTTIRTWCGLYTATYASPSDWYTYEPHGAVGVYSWNAGGVVTHTGTTPTAVNSPTVGVLSGANNKYGATFSAASSQYYTVNGNEANASGNDKPFGFIHVARPNNTAAIKQVLEFSHSTGTGRATCFLDASEQMSISVVDDANAAASSAAGSSNSVTEFCTTWNASLGTSTEGLISVTTSAVKTQVAATINVGTKALNIATIGARRIAGTPANYFDGDLVFAAMWAGNAPNMAQCFQIAGMAKAWFAAG
jgi:hypothetical protein